MAIRADFLLTFAAMYAKPDLKMENTTLLQQLIDKSGLSEREAIKALNVVADFAKERFPILEGTINAYIKQEFRNADLDSLDDSAN